MGPNPSPNPNPNPNPDADPNPRLERYVRGKRALELGSGPGILGLAVSAGALGAAPSSITLTDLAEVVPLLRINVALNAVFGAIGGEETDASSCVRCGALPWGDADAAHALSAAAGGSFDVVLVADCVYDPAGYEPLCATLSHLAAANPKVVILLSYRHRNPESHRFFEMLRGPSGFTVAELPGLRSAGGAGGGDVRFFDVTLAA